MLTQVSQLLIVTPLFFLLSFCWFVRELWSSSSRYCFLLMDFRTRFWRRFSCQGKAIKLLVLKSRRRRRRWSKRTFNIQEIGWTSKTYSLIFMIAIVGIKHPFHPFSTPSFFLFLLILPCVFLSLFLTLWRWFMRRRYVKWCFASS